MMDIFMLPRLLSMTFRGKLHNDGHKSEHERVVSIEHK